MKTYLRSFSSKHNPHVHSSRQRPYRNSSGDGRTASRANGRNTIRKASIGLDSGIGKYSGWHTDGRNRGKRTCALPALNHKTGFIHLILYPSEVNRSWRSRDRRQVSGSGRRDRINVLMILASSAVYIG